MNRRRISRNRLEGAKNVKRQPVKVFREKMTFKEWFNNGINRCKFLGASVFVDREYRQVFIRWSAEEEVVRTIDDFYIEYCNEYCSQWRN